MPTTSDFTSIPPSHLIRTAFTHWAIVRGRTRAEDRNGDFQRSWSCSPHIACVEKRPFKRRRHVPVLSPTPPSLGLLRKRINDTSTHAMRFCWICCRTTAHGDAHGFPNALG